MKRYPTAALFLAIAIPAWTVIYILGWLLDPKTKHEKI